MKHTTIYNKFSFWAALSAIIFLSSCIKNYREGETKFTDLQPVVLIPEGGLAAFGAQSLNFLPTDESDVYNFRVNYAATNVAPADQKITIAIDADALAAYNASSDIKYVMFPDSIYSFSTTEVTVKAGQSYSDVIPLTVYPNKVDASKNYMLPISIKNASGNTIISSNFGTVYPHFIGNPIAGSYSWDWSRWDAADSTSVPQSGLSFTANPTVFLPDNPTQVEVATGYYTGPRYIINFTNTNGTLSDFTVAFNQDDIDAATAASSGGVTFGPITILKADPVKKIFQFQYTAFSSGNPRYIVDTYYKP